MTRRVNLLISYGSGLDKAEGEHLGVDNGGLQLYRVWRQPLRPGDPVRIDVLRLRPQNGPGFDFVGTADPARPGTAYFTVPQSCVGRPAFDAFIRRLEDHACVMESEWHAGYATYLVFTHAADAPVDDWYEQMLRETIGIAPDEVRGFIRSQRFANERKSVRRKSRGKITRKLSRYGRALVGLATILLAGTAIFAVVGGGLSSLVGAASGERPVVAAVGMLVSLAPILLTRDGRKSWPLLLGCGVIGLGLVAMLDGPSPPYGAAAALAAVYALGAGFTGAFFGILSGFSSNAQQMGRVIFLFVLPLLASAACAATVAVTSAAAAGRSGGFGSAARTVAIVVTALLLLAPAAVLISNAAAILGGKVWRENPKLQLKALATMPLTLAPMLVRVAVPIAFVWGVVLMIEWVG